MVRKVRLPCERNSQISASTERRCHAHCGRWERRLPKSSWAIEAGKASVHDGCLPGRVDGKCVGKDFLVEKTAHARVRDAVVKWVMGLFI